MNECRPGPAYATDFTNMIFFINLGCPGSLNSLPMFYTCNTIKRIRKNLNKKNGKEKIVTQKLIIYLS